MLEDQRQGLLLLTAFLIGDSLKTAVLFHLMKGVEKHEKD